VRILRAIERAAGLMRSARADDEKRRPA